MKKRMLLLLISMMFFTSVISAEIIINQQPEDLYSLGDTIEVPVTISSGSEAIYDVLKISLICNGQEHVIQEYNIPLPANEIMKVTNTLPLIKKFVGNAYGTCQIKASLEENIEEYDLTEEFEISKTIDITLRTTQREFNPGEKILFEGEATKKNNDPVNGFLEVNVFIGNASNKTYKDTVENGFFSLSFEFPKDTEAGTHNLKITAYEKDPLDEITNMGTSDQSITINQIPTSLEIAFEAQEMNPGSDLKVKAILHDQTGRKIDSSAIVTIKDGNDKILEQTEISTDEYIKYQIAYNEAPAEWKVVAVSNKLTSESPVKIKENEDVKVDIINKTLILTNIGNVQYNETLLVKIGEESLNVVANLEVDEVKKYQLTAPDGEYEIQVITDGESKVSKQVLLTGNAINVKEVSGTILIARYPIMWIFILLILGFAGFILFKRGYKKKFVGYIQERKNKVKTGIQPTSFEKKEQKLLINTKNRAILTLSLKGEKRTTDLICLRIKNHEDIMKNPESVKETFEKIKNIVDESKTNVYESGDSIIFLFSPLVTKTFKNEREIINLAKKVEKILSEHNKLFKQNINFGISINYGETVAKKDGDILRFMSLGNLIAESKKIASVSEGDIYLSKKMKDKMMSNVKTERKDISGQEVYSIKEVKENSEQTKKFISEFIKRIETGKKE